MEASLERLQTPYIDLLYTHCWDDATPLEETLETLGWLVQQGKVWTTGMDCVCMGIISGQVYWVQQYDRLAAPACCHAGQAAEYWEVHCGAAAVQPPLQGGGVGGEGVMPGTLQIFLLQVTTVAEREGIAILPWSHSREDGFLAR